MIEQDYAFLTKKCKRCGREITDRPVLDLATNDWFHAGCYGDFLNEEMEKQERARAFLLGYLFVFGLAGLLCAS